MYIHGEDDVTLPFEEKNAVRCVGGYVVHSLKTAEETDMFHILGRAS